MLVNRMIMSFLFAWYASEEFVWWARFPLVPTWGGSWLGREKKDVAWMSSRQPRPRKQERKNNKKRVKRIPKARQRGMAQERTRCPERREGKERRERGKIWDEEKREASSSNWGWWVRLPVVQCPTLH